METGGPVKYPGLENSSGLGGYPAMTMGKSVSEGYPSFSGSSGYPGFD